VSSDCFDDVIYELMRRAEAKSESRPAAEGLDDLPQLIMEKVRKALDGMLVETLKSTPLPAVGYLGLEIPVELSAGGAPKARAGARRLPGHSDESPVAHGAPSSAPTGNTGGAGGTGVCAMRALELDAPGQRVVSYWGVGVGRALSGGSCGRLAYRAHAACYGATGTCTCAVAVFACQKP